MGIREGAQQKLGGPEKNLRGKKIFRRTKNGGLSKKKVIKKFRGNGVKAVLGKPDH